MLTNVAYHVLLYILVGLRRKIGQLAGKHETQCCFHVGPPSTTLAKHENNIE